MTVQQIKAAVDAGKVVHWSNNLYEVRKNKDQYLIVCTSNDYAIGLTWRDGVTLNGEEDQFFLAEPEATGMEVKLSMNKSQVEALQKYMEVQYVDGEEEKEYRTVSVRIETPAQARKLWLAGMLYGLDKGAQIVKETHNL